MSPHKHNFSSLSANMEDYLETIYLQENQGNTAKVKSIAKAMNVSKPSVTEALSILKDRGLVIHQKYGDVELTEKGKEVAGNIYYRHCLFFSFFYKVLKIPPELAEDDACKIEHLVSNVTVQRFSAFMKVINNMTDYNGKYAGFLDSVYDEIEKYNQDKLSLKEGCL